MSLETPAVITLHPGDVAVGQRGDQLETLLGSCISIVLTDPRRTVGAMCHIVHSGAPAAAAADCGTHAEAAFDTMVELLQERGIAVRLCQAYVYGGGNMFPQVVPPLHVGDSNARWALARLAALGIRVIDVDVGGSAYRRLRWTIGPDAPQVVSVAV